MSYNSLRLNRFGVYLMSKGALGGTSMRTLLGILAIVCWVQSVFAESEQLRFSFESLEDSIVTVNVLENGFQSFVTSNCFEI